MKHSIRTHYTFLIGFCLLMPFFSPAQMALTSKQLEVRPTSPAERKSAVEKKKQLRATSIFKNYPIRNIGPTVMGGRVVDIAVHQDQPSQYYVAYASGGLYKTNNNGLSFESVFDHQDRLTIGDIALSPANHQIVWVGTGENNSSRSSYAGYGIYKSEDGGETWSHKGLENTQHIGRVIAHPRNPDIAWVASIGALYSKNPERGVYKTTDGGNSWKKTLFVNDSTGIIDLIVNPNNPDQLWAAAWERHRYAWEFKENGPGSGLYVSEDGGESWKEANQGLPPAADRGRIGLDICREQPNTLYLIMDNQGEIKEKKEGTEKLKYAFADFEKMSVQQFLAIDDQDLDTFLSKKGFPRIYKAQKVKAEVKAGKYPPSALANYFKSANDDLFNTSIKGAEIYRSDDFGKNWKKVNTYALDRLYNTYGYYFGQIRVDPKNPDVIYIFGVPLLRSDDGGKTYKSITYQKDVHADHHALWINPKNPKHILNGNDGGIYMSYDKGENFLHLNNVSVGQFYTVDVDMEKPYNVYGGLQDNGVFKGSSRFRPNQGRFWERLWGGDGMYVQVNPENSALLYTGFQFGNYWRLQGSRRKRITPVQQLGEAALRFNWRTPLVMSEHNSDILYIGAQKVYRSLDKGDHWMAISPDLTKNKPAGNVPYSTISIITESPLQFGMLYVGTDDGNIHLSRDGGNSWELISEQLPADRWVSGIYASVHDKATVYATLNGYRYDELAAYVYKSVDYGKTWVSISSNLPPEAVNVIVQDPVDPSLLFLGTDEGAYVSMNDGQSWELLSGAFPNVATYDMVVHPREHELVLATHGRSMYVMDVKPLRNVKDNALKLFTPSALTYSERWGPASMKYLPPREPKVEILYFVNNESGKEVKLRLKDDGGNIIREWNANSEKGFHQLEWNASDAKGSYLKKGTYQLELQQGKDLDKGSWVIKSRS